jgi:hypothetical protein
MSAVHLHTHHTSFIMPQMPAVQFQDTKFVAILRTDQNQAMQVYHTNSACSTYQYHHRELAAQGQPFMGNPVECFYCQQLNERGE